MVYCRYIVGCILWSLWKTTQYSVNQIKLPLEIASLLLKSIFTKPVRTVNIFGCLIIPYWPVRYICYFSRLPISKSVSKQQPGLTLALINFIPPTTNPFEFIRADRPFIQCTGCHKFSDNIKQYDKCRRNRKIQYLMFYIHANSKTLFPM